MAPHNKFDDIIPPSRRREAERSGSTPSLEPRISHASSRSSHFPYLTTGIVLAVIGLSAAALYIFSSAKVEVVPNVLSVAAQGSFTANQDSGELPFKVITAEKVASRSVKSTGTKTVSTAASGTITIYNTQSKPQTLINNTRFATSAGLIFRIHAPVTIPAGSTAKPGSITAKVYADQAGSTYNVGPSSFTIPGFAGTPQATMVYARSTSPMTGGASGAVPVVDATVSDQARSALIEALAPDLTKSLQDQLVKEYPGYILLPGAATTTYQELTPTPSETAGMVEVKEQGTITAVIFPGTAFAKAVASSVPGINYQGGPLSLSSTSALTLVPTGGIPDSAATSFSFSLSGNASFIYNVDASRIAAAVAGKTRSAAQVALTNYPEVDRATLLLRPFWKQTFPEDPAAISVVVTNP